MEQPDDTTIAVCVALVVAAGLVYFTLGGGEVRIAEVPLPEKPLARSVQDATFSIGDAPLPLQNGRAEPAPLARSTGKDAVETSLSATVEGDLDGDGGADKALILAREGDEGRVSYYLAAAIKDKKGGYSGTNAVLLAGAVESPRLQIKKWVIIASYKGLKAGMPADAAPIGIQKYAQVEGGILKDIPKPTGF